MREVIYSVTDMIKILILDTSNSEYIIQLWRFVKKYYPELDIYVLTSDAYIDDYKNAGEDFYTHTYFYADRKYVRTISFIMKLLSSGKYDVVHTLWIEKMWGHFASLIKGRGKVWLSSVGGSDLYRHSFDERVKKIQLNVLNKADGYSSENSKTRDYFYSVYGDKYKNKIHNINRYGVDVIEEINDIDVSQVDALKEKWSVPKDKIVIMLGHNARVEHQHMKMISAIDKLDETILDKCFFVIPMTYPSKEKAYIKEVGDRLSQITDNYLVLTKYMNVREMAETTKFTDVMIHVQTTDQLSSTMMAHMYDENIVIAGSWLPYSDIRNAGIEFYDVDDISDITALLTDVVENFDMYKEKVKNNRENVYRFSSWEYAAKAWYNTYIELLEENKK